MCFKNHLDTSHNSTSITIPEENGVAMSATINFHPKNLGDLPDELLQQICSLLPSQGDLAALCLVSQRMNSIADPLLHHSIFFDEPKHHVTFAQSLSTRPRRGSLIQNVRVEYPSHELAEFMHWKDGSYRIDHFSHSISTMSNLENLVVSVPVELLQGIGTLFNGPFDLACLKSCTLYYQCEDDGYWDLQENIHIFSHPSLEHLTIKRARLDERGFDALEKPWYTALKTLHLIECDLNDDGLSDILMHPEALEEIHITQLEEPIPALEEAPEDVGDYILAFKSAMHSLKTVCIDFPTLGSKKPMRLREFVELKSLQLRDYQLFGQKTPRMNSVGLPPNLEVLKFLDQVGDDEEIADLLQYTIENKEVLASKWKKMIVEGYGVPPPVILEACRPFKDFLHLTRRRRTMSSMSALSARSPTSPTLSFRNHSWSKSFG